MELFIDFIIVLFAIIVAYLLGSIPTSIWVAKYRYGIDIRKHGSGNAGATNTFRVLGKKAGSFVMLIDISKGFLATSLASLLVLWNVVEYDNFLIYKEIMYKLIFGATAVVGHIFPVFAKFKGGKGVATLLGMMLAVHAPATLLCVLVFLVVLISSKYVSLGSILATLTFPLLIISFPKFRPVEDAPVLIAFGFLMFLVVVITHQKNISRLINGEERRANIKLRKSK